MDYPILLWIVRAFVAIATLGSVVFFKDYVRYLGGNRYLAAFVVMLSALLTVCGIFGYSPGDILHQTKVYTIGFFWREREFARVSKKDRVSHQGAIWDLVRNSYLTGACRQAFNQITYNRTVGGIAFFEIPAKGWEETRPDGSTKVSYTPTGPNVPREWKDLCGFYVRPAQHHGDTDSLQSAYLDAESKFDALQKKAMQIGRIDVDRFIDSEFGGTWADKSTGNLPVNLELFDLADEFLEDVKGISFALLPHAEPPLDANHMRPIVCDLAVVMERLWQTRIVGDRSKSEQIACTAHRVRRMNEVLGEDLDYEGNNNLSQCGRI